MDMINSDYLHKIYKLAIRYDGFRRVNERRDFYSIAYCQHICFILYLVGRDTRYKIYMVVCVRGIKPSPKNRQRKGSIIHSCFAVSSWNTLPNQQSHRRWFELPRRGYDVTGNVQSVWVYFVTFNKLVYLQKHKFCPFWWYLYSCNINTSLNSHLF